MKAKKSNTAKYYAENPEAAEKRRAYQRKLNKRPDKKKYRAELVKINRKAGTYGNGDGKDYDHGERKFMSAKKNRSKKFEKGGKVDPKEKKADKKPVSSNIATTLLRNSPMLKYAPEPAKQLIASTVTRDNKYGWDDMDSSMKRELAKSVMAARQRTGKNKGGTEYEDYSGRISKDINSLGTNAVDGLLGSYLAPDFKTATTMGRVSYDYDPETDTYSVYDSYDFNKVGSSNTAYGKIRKAAGEMGVSDGKPNLVAQFKGSDFADADDPFISYDDITDVTDVIGDKLKKGKKKVKDTGKDLYELMKSFME